MEEDERQYNEKKGVDGQEVGGHDQDKGQPRQTGQQSAPEPKPEEDVKNDKGPAGGYDSTPIPQRPRGYTVKFTFHRAQNLPMADLNALSSDPYVLAQLNTDTPTRHKEDPNLRFRTSTVRKSIDPEWEQSWTVANVPSSGFKLKLRVYDEDPNDNDDRLGNVHIDVPSIDDSWTGLPEQEYKLKKRSGSKRAYLLQAIITCFHTHKHMAGDIFVSIQNLGRTPEDGQSGRLYTVGPTRWIQHYSPMLGRITGRKEPDNSDKSTSTDANARQQSDPEQRKVERYNFQANQIQLDGPIPPKLYHRFVEFKPWVKRMFTSSGLQGLVLGKALHHQHNRVYHFDRAAQCGELENPPSDEVTRKFLELVHHDKGGRIFTYVLTLDALWRFTETGKEFGIDMLSKHTMHSDVSIYIAFSGEFFVRRLKHARRPPPPDPVDETSQDHPPKHESNQTHPAATFAGGPPDEEPTTDPAFYELIIDNDSGTYRPNAALLPELRKYLGKALPGLHIQTLDCQADADKMNKWKQEQRERKKVEGDHIVYRQGSLSSNSVSSSDIDDLDEREARVRSSIAHANAGAGAGAGAGERGPAKAAARDAKLRQQAKWAKAKRTYGGAPRDQPIGEDGQPLDDPEKNASQNDGAAGDANVNSNVGKEDA